MFNGRIDDITHAAIRSLTETRPATGEKYRTELKRLLLANNIYARRDRLASTLARDGPTASLVQTYNTLDADITMAMLSAEKRCNRKKWGHQWSPTLYDACLWVRYWHHRRTCCRIGREPYPWAAPLLRHLGEIDETGNDKEQIIDCLRKVWKILRAPQKDAATHRKDHMKARAEEEAKQNNLTTETALKTLIAREALRSAWRKIRPTTQGHCSGALSRVLIPDPLDPQSNNPKQCKKWMEVSDSDEIHRLLLDRNSHALSAASGTVTTILNNHMIL